MPYTKRIVCLANSRKQQGHCIAGKEITSAGFGKWIRPVSSETDGKLWDNHICYHDDQVPRLLDIIRIHFRKHKLHSYQAENHLIDEDWYWQCVGRIPLADLPALCDPVETLWINGSHSTHGLNDRIPVKIAERELTSSLLLIKPQQFSLTVAQEFKTKVRANFFVNDTEYALSVTDPVVERAYRSREYGEYPIVRRNIYLCISLTEPFDGFTYKLVAAIINIPLK